MPEYTYTRRAAAHFRHDGLSEIVTIPDQIDDAQREHDKARTVFPVIRDRIHPECTENVVLDGEAYGLHTPGTGDCTVRLPRYTIVGVGDMLIATIREDQDYDAELQRQTAEIPCTIVDERDPEADDAHQQIAAADLWKQDNVILTDEEPADRDRIVWRSGHGGALFVKDGPEYRYAVTAQD